MTIFEYFIVFLVGIIGVYVGRMFAMRRGLRKRVRAYDAATSAVGRRKREAKDKILTLFEKRERIANDDVEQALGVSDATATNYLQELEDEKIIVQHGKQGRGVYYTKING